MRFRYRSSAAQFDELERQFDKAASAQVEPLETSIVQTAFAPSAGLDLLISAYANGDRDHRARIRQLLTLTLRQQIEKANYVISALDRIAEHSNKAKVLAVEAAEDIVNMKICEGTLGLRGAKLAGSCNTLADREEERLKGIQATKSVVARMRDRWISALGDVQQG